MKKLQDWIEGNYLTTEEGSPLRLFHGTRPGVDIDRFHEPNPLDGIYLTPDPSYANGFTNALFEPHPLISQGAIFPVHAQVKNPFIVKTQYGSEEWEQFCYHGFDMAELRKKGFDGAVLIEEEDGIDQVVIFSPDQIISAIGHNHNFEDRPGYLNGRTNEELAHEINHFLSSAKLTFLDTVTDHYSGQTNCTLSVQSNADVVAKIEYVIYQDEISVSMISVPESERRKGYATQALVHLQSLHPRVEIEMGYLTTEGSALLSSLHFTHVPNIEVLAHKHELKSAKIDLADLIQQAQFMENDRPRYIAFLERQGERWNDLQSRIDELEHQLYDCKDHRKIINHGQLGWDDSPAFRQWFQNSLCSDELGRPLPVFHGTLNDFTVFATAEGTQEGASFFTPDSDIASHFANPDLVGVDAPEDDLSPNVMKVYLSIQNPMVIPASKVLNQHQQHNFDLMSKAIKNAKSHGYDGLLILDTPEAGKTANQWVAFSPAQIKTAIGLSKDFNPKSESILGHDEAMDNARKAKEFLRAEISSMACKKKLSA